MKRCLMLIAVAILGLTLAAGVGCPCGERASDYEERLDELEQQVATLTDEFEQLSIVPEPVELDVEPVDVPAMETSREYIP